MIKLKYVLAAAVCTGGVFLFSSFGETKMTLEEQTKKAMAMVEDNVSTFESRKRAECKAMALQKAIGEAETLLATPSAPVKPGVTKPTAPVKKGTKPAPKPAPTVKPSPAPAPKHDMETTGRKVDPATNAPNVQTQGRKVDPATNTQEVQTTGRRKSNN